MEFFILIIIVSFIWILVRYLTVFSKMKEKKKIQMEMYKRDKIKRELQTKTLMENKKQLEKIKKDEELRIKSLIGQYGKLSVEEIVLNENIEHQDKIEILKSVHNYYWEEAEELIKTAEKERSKARLLAIKRKISKKAFELYGNIPVDDKRAPLSDDVKLFVWNRDGGKCVKCGGREKLEFDHIIPFSKGGSDTTRNIQLLCEKCNRSKGGELV